MEGQLEMLHTLCEEDTATLIAWRNTQIIHSPVLETRFVPGGV